MSIPIIDTHQHLWDLSKVAYDWLVPEYGPLYRTYLATELEPQMAEAGVTATVMVQSANSYADTVYMLDQADVYDWMIGVVGWVPLLDPAETGKALARFTQNRYFKGVRHLIHEEANPHWLLQDPVYESLQLLADAGLTFEERNTDDLKEKLHMLVNSEDLRRELGPKGRQRVMEHYTNTKIAEKIHGVYKEMLR